MGIEILSVRLLSWEMVGTWGSWFWAVSQIFRKAFGLCPCGFSALSGLHSLLCPAFLPTQQLSEEGFWPVLIKLRNLGAVPCSPPQGGRVRGLPSSMGVPSYKGFLSSLNKSKQKKFDKIQSPVLSASLWTGIHNTQMKKKKKNQLETQDLGLVHTRHFWKKKKNW